MDGVQQIVYSKLKKGGRTDWQSRFNWTATIPTGVLLKLPYGLSIQNYVIGEESERTKSDYENGCGINDRRHQIEYKNRDNQCDASLFF